MAKKKPRRPLAVLHPRTAQAQNEFRTCDAPGCPNIISVIDRAVTNGGPIYCRLHAHLEEKT